MTRHITSLLVVVLWGCALSPVPLATSEKKRVQTLHGTADHIVECKYEMRNCEREARKTCGGRYVEVSRGDRTCADCGWDSSSAAATPVWRGTLYVRCE